MSTPVFTNKPTPNPLTVSSCLPAKSFLSDISVYSVDSGGALASSIGDQIERLALAAIESGTAELSVDPGTTHSNSSAALAIPIHCNERVVSVAVLSAKQVVDDQDGVVGVFEIWEPIGVYDEVALKLGWYGKLERFQNVSSFVRFEKGSGLPGQVWSTRHGVIHDDLSNHSGFLRAAGASAERLQTAIGIPIFTNAFHAAVVLISSSTSPIARGFEIWQAQEQCFSLMQSAYRGLGDGVELPPEAILPRDTGLPALAAKSIGAVLCNDVQTVYAGRSHDAILPKSACALAIPTLDGNRLTSVTNLLF